MSGTVALCCFFAPKVYIVLWQPYKNVRTRQSAVGRLVNQQMRFISQIATSAAPECTPICTSIGEYSSNPHVATPSVDSEGPSLASKPAATPNPATTPTAPTASTTNNTTTTRQTPVITQPLLELSSDEDATTTVTETTPFIESNNSSSPPLIPYSFSDVVKDTVTQQHQVEMILDQIASNNNVTFL
ncbi:unnamed protein product [Anisakis simplex]|uniref:G_PROTEIN_RECEP_F3_4 domain-containing protein n=1 Tax=Anisakis simplex TaxID=6269 RepID=A0A0M3KI27_ANISI|nr:unnamed protein product [Anisakis simplex]